MSKEYIERSATIAALEDTDWYTINKNGEVVLGASSGDTSFFKAHDMFILLRKTPAADVAPVVHAHWKTREEYNDYLWVECSNCGFRVENYKAVKTGMSSTDIIGNKWNACPVCCARMDGGK